MSPHDELNRVWRIKGRCIAHPPPASWRDDLSTRLGQRPRRLGIWTELALYGALMCLEDAGETALPHDAILRVSSTVSTSTAFFSALAQSREGFLMPISFLQSQPGQMLAALANHLDWQGDANLITTPDPLTEARLACVESGRGGLLIGWVDDGPASRSVWLRLAPAERPSLPFLAAAAESISDMSMQYWQLTPGGLTVA